MATSSILDIAGKKTALSAVFGLILISVFVTPLSSQELRQVSPDQLGLDALPEEYEDTIRNLVERYEELRRLLREQIQRNTELYTKEEIDSTVSELEAELLASRTENRELRNEYKELLQARKNAEEDALRYKERYAKVRGDLTDEIDTLGTIIDSIEEEQLLQIGATFSPAGRIGGIGILNLPGTNVSLLTEGIYDLREKEFSTAFGIGFGLFSQRPVVEEYLRRGSPSSETESPTE